MERLTDEDGRLDARRIGDAADVLYATDVVEDDQWEGLVHECPYFDPEDGPAWCGYDDLVEINGDPERVRVENETAHTTSAPGEGGDIDRHRALLVDAAGRVWSVPESVIDQVDAVDEEHPEWVPLGPSDRVWSAPRKRGHSFSQYGR